MRVAAAAGEERVSVSWFDRLDENEKERTTSLEGVGIDLVGLQIARICAGCRAV